MIQLKLELPQQVLDEDPDMDNFVTFIQQMLNRMAMSHFKYGNMADKYPHNANALSSGQKRVHLYQKTGNIEHLLDAANFFVIEALFPSHENAHFKAESSKDSPGLEWNS